MCNQLVSHLFNYVGQYGLCHDHHQFSYMQFVSLIGAHEASSAIISTTDEQLNESMLWLIDLDVRTNQPTYSITSQ